MDTAPASAGSTTAAPLVSLLELFPVGSSQNPARGQLRLTGKIQHLGSAVLNLAQTRPVIQR
jgi:hypothetical protein